MKYFDVARTPDGGLVIPVGFVEVRDYTKADYATGSHLSSWYSGADVRTVANGSYGIKTFIKKVTIKCCY